MATIAEIDISSPQAFNVSQDNQFFDITFKNTAAFSYAAGNIYFYALLTDSTTPSALTQEVTFVVTEATAGTYPINTVTPFTFKNTMNLVPTVTGSNGRILYTA